ncbi:MAG: hypothetical protein RL076_671 [Chloroflexota bacterium]|jgi:cyclopropane fatty-acyl-phospholipid synthase-like methyltransferase
MDFRRYYSIVESTHTIQNPTSPQKMDRLIDALQLTNHHHVLDIGCGKGWLLTRMAERCGIRGTGVEINPWFCTAAHARAQMAGVADRISIIESDARNMLLADAQYDVAVCIGATFALGDLATCLATMRRVVKPGGYIAVGDIYRYDHAPIIAQWQTVPDLPTLVDQVRGTQEPHELITASVEEWDMYYARQWRAAQQWQKSNADDPEYAAFCQRATQSRDDYLRYERPYIGWAIVVAVNE